jgi:hypothetical protein
MKIQPSGKCSICGKWSSVRFSTPEIIDACRDCLEKHALEEKKRMFRASRYRRKHNRQPFQPDIKFHPDDP